MFIGFTQRPKTFTDVRYHMLVIRFRAGRVLVMKRHNSDKELNVQQGVKGFTRKVYGDGFTSPNARPNVPNQNTTNGNEKAAAKVSSREVGKSVSAYKEAMRKRLAQRRVEVWKSPEGIVAALNKRPIYDEDWFAESPGELPNAYFALTDENGTDIYTFSVSPLKPWTAEDAAQDKLNMEGWGYSHMVDGNGEVVPEYIPKECVHGLSADLCYSPDNHYGSHDDYDY